MGAKIETIIKIYNIYFYYCPKKIPPISKCLMTLMTNDLNDHPLFLSPLNLLFITPSSPLQP